MRSVAIAIAATTLALFACHRDRAGSGADASASSASPAQGDHDQPEKGAPAASGAAPMVSAAKGGEALATAGAVRPESCKAACEHRKECGVTSDVPGCLRDCASVSSLFTDGELQEYAKTDCKGVKAGDPLFQTAVGCRAACDHRASCVPSASDVPRCVASCCRIATPAPRRICGRVPW